MFIDILFAVCLLLGFLPCCFVYIRSCLADYKENKKFRECVILLLNDIREYLYSTGGDIIEERED